jgi:hypothetical protein
MARYSGTCSRPLLDRHPSSPRQKCETKSRDRDAVVYVDIPIGVNDGAKKKIFQELYEEIHEAWPIPDTRACRGAGPAAAALGRCSGHSLDGGAGAAMCRTGNMCP